MPNGGVHASVDRDDLVAPNARLIRWLRAYCMSLSGAEAITATAFSGRLVSHHTTAAIKKAKRVMPSLCIIASSSNSRSSPGSR
jgi:hypothetical protein